MNNKSFNNIRVIPRLDIKGPNLVKGIHLEGLRVLGKPEDFALRYYNEGADEIIYMDIVASLYGRDNLLGVVRKTAKNIFIPLTAGGGVRTLDDIRDLLRAGADKVAINTAAVKNPDLITKAAKMFGSQCIVVSIEAGKKEDGSYEAYTDNGREKTGLDVLEWVKQAAELGAGEILITSIDREGTGKGYDTELISKAAKSVSIPVIACGGAGSKEHILEIIKKGRADAVSAGSIFHYSKSNIMEVKSFLGSEGVVYRENKKRGKSVSNKNYSPSLAIIDYGLGNLFSIKKALEYAGAKPLITDNPEEIKSADGLILPGVGAFSDGMKGLKKRNLIEPIKSFVAEGKPLFGICLGMQLLMAESEEFGRHKGLDLIKGRVIRLQEPKSKEGCKIPHIGWNKIQKPKSSLKIEKSWQATPLENIEDKDDFYFVHSYMIVPDDPSDITAVTEYGDNIFCSMISKGNIFGCQFHPEKSGEAGLKYYKNIIDICRS